LLPLPDTTVATRRHIARKYKLSEFPDPQPFLHIRCGDDILDKLDQAGLPGDKIRWTDVLCEGPLHQHANEVHRRRERAAYLAARYQVPFTETYREIMGADWRVSQCVRYTETVLWFEADLFDQAILVYLLTRLRPLAEDTRVSLICIGSFPGVRRFVGLGQLTPAQLATLLPGRQPITRGQFQLAAQAWDALNSASPREVQRLSCMRSRALPFLPAALRRYLEEYPSTRNGLGRTEQLVLEAFAAGPRTPFEAFPQVQEREPRPYQGDAMFYAVVRGLVSGDPPALTGGHPRLGRLRESELRECPVWLTDLGRRLLANKADWCRSSQAARWIGGVLLRGAAPGWRWDPARGRVVARRRR
jgi:hypothetical protein